MPSLLEEKDAIRDLMYRYCFTSDRAGDPDGWAALFTEDGIWESDEARLEGREQMRRFFGDSATA